MSRSNVSQRKITSREEGKKLDELAEEILELYKADTLDEVMKKINSKHNLNASKSQYRKRLEQWRVKKNVRHSDLRAWKRAGQALRETKHVDHKSALMYAGRVYSMQQVQRVLRRRDTPKLADKFALSQQGSKSFEGSRAVAVVLLSQRNPEFQMDSADLYRYFRGKYDAPWPNGLMLSMPIPRMLDRLTQTLTFYRETCIRYSRLWRPGLAETLLLSIPQPVTKSPLGVSVLTHQNALLLLHTMAYAIANHVRYAKPSGDILCDLFHQVKHDKSWLEGLFSSKDPIARCLSREIFTSVFAEGNVAAIERCLQAGADTTHAVMSRLGEGSMLVASLERQDLQLAKCLHRHAAPWTVPLLPQQKPIRELLSSSAGHWLVRDDVWEFVSRSYPQYRSEAYEFIQRKPNELYENWMVVQKLLPMYPDSTYSKHWQSAILFHSMLAESTTSFPAINNATTLKEYEECLGQSAIAKAIFAGVLRGTSEDQMLHAIKKMLPMGASLDTGYDILNNPLMSAISRGYWSIVEFILDCGVSTTKALRWMRSISLGKLPKPPAALLHRIYQPDGMSVKDAIRHNLPPDDVRHLLRRDNDDIKSGPQEEGSEPLLTWIIQEKHFRYLGVLLEHDPTAYGCQALRTAVMLYLGEDEDFLKSGGPDFIEKMLLRRQVSTEPCANEGIAVVFASCAKSEQLISRLSDAGIRLSQTLRTHSVASVRPWYPGRCEVKKSAISLARSLGSTLRLPCNMIESQEAFDFLVGFDQPGAVRSMLNQGLKVTARHLVVAIRYGRIDMLDILLQNGGFISEEHLQEACYLQDLPLIMKLLDLGARATSHMWTVSPLGRNRTTFQIAVQLGRIAIIEALIEHGADVNEPAGEVRGATALQLAAGAGRTVLARRLIELGADCNAPAGRTDGRTALEAAAEHGRLTMVQFLLHLGVSTTEEERRQYIRAVKFAATEHHTIIETILRAHRPWTDEDWQLWEEECYDPEISDSTSRGDISETASELSTTPTRQALDLNDGQGHREEDVASESEESDLQPPDFLVTQEFDHRAVDQSEHSARTDAMAWDCGLDESNDMGLLTGTEFGNNISSSSVPTFGSPPLNMLLGQSPGHDTFASDLIFGADLSFSVYDDVMAGQGVQDASHSRLVLPFSETVASGSGDISKRHCEACGNHLEQCYCVDFSFLDDMEIFDDDLLPLSED